MIAARSPVVVTGAAGNLGSRLVAWLEKAGREVRPVDIVPFAHPRAIVDDLAEPRDRSWMAGARALVHLAGCPDANAPWPVVERANVETTRRMVEAVRQYGVERLVLASSVWAMRGRWDAGEMLHPSPAEPGDRPYARSKAAAEALAASAAGDGLSVAVLRLGGRFAGNARPVHLDDWEDACWLGWRDFLHGMERALDAPVDGLATVTLVSDNPARRWSLEEGKRLLGYEPRQSFSPARHPGLVRRIGRFLLGG